jgi:hypothetical protein
MRRRGTCTLAGGLITAALLMGGVTPALASAEVSSGQNTFAPSRSTLAPTQATGVSSYKQYTSSLGTVQLRVGTYGGRKYYWARVTNPGSTLNSDYNVYLIVDGPGSHYVVETKDISGTTYTAAWTIASGYTYMACWGKKTSSTASTCVKTTA